MDGEPLASSCTCAQAKDEKNYRDREQDEEGRASTDKSLQNSPKHTSTEARARAHAHRVLAK